MKKIIPITVFVLFALPFLHAQCDPPFSLSCDSAEVLCALDQLQGMTCITPDHPNPSNINVSCTLFDTFENTQWWAFLGNGSSITIQFYVDSTVCRAGIQAGIIQGCSDTSLACNTSCAESEFSLTFDSEKCQEYHLWVDGCFGSVCEYRVEVMGGQAPNIPRPPQPLSVFGQPCLCNEILVCTLDSFHRVRGHTTMDYRRC